MAEVTPRPKGVIVTPPRTAEPFQAPTQGRARSSALVI
jgi:hypothetical protein